jgi:hypothetical protein
MTRFYDIDDANAVLPELGAIVGVLGEQRSELVRLRDQVLAAQKAGGEGAASSVGGTSGGAVGDAPGTATGGPDEPSVPGELRLTRLRMQGLIDQMAAGVARIDALGLTLRDIERGLVDFPALVSGRQVWLCWQLGETSIGWWHGHDTGFDGRRPLAELA